MTSIEKSNKVSDEVRVKNEPICYSQPISKTKTAKNIKEEPIDMSEEVKIKTEEEETNAYLNEETKVTPSDNKPITSKSQKIKVNISFLKKEMNLR